ncbi:protein of unknown function [Trichlorobacter ammonificans]|uniref:Uncharacterized protein n=1 Tax=Trichlorobacter ammonificans TaxID=2916410 RepID=A0ABM9D8M8_9BACT|nr:protein of unknown function [Trichlorobacter ammonificans]
MLHWFQSTPALWDGRFRRGVAMKLLTNWVSIHARPLGRALLNTACGYGSISQFQSTPALWDGRFRRWPAALPCDP